MNIMPIAWSNFLLRFGLALCGTVAILCGIGAACMIAWIIFLFVFNYIEYLLTIIAFVAFLSWFAERGY